jgi:hypothetical protein
VAHYQKELGQKELWQKELGQNELGQKELWVLLGLWVQVQLHLQLIVKWIHTLNNCAYLSAKKRE